MSTKSAASKQNKTYSSYSVVSVLINSFGYNCWTITDGKITLTKIDKSTAKFSTINKIVLPLTQYQISIQEIRRLLRRAEVDTDKLIRAL